MKKAIICISLCLCLVLAFVAGAAYPNLNYGGEKYGTENADGTFTLKFDVDNQDVRSTFVNFTQPIGDYFDMKFNATFPDYGTDAWLAFVISDSPDGAGKAYSKDYEDCIIVQYRGFGQLTDAYPANILSANKAANKHPWVNGAVDLIYSNILAPMFAEKEDHVFAIRKSEEYGFTFEMDGVKYLDATTGEPMDFTAVAERWADKELYVGVLMYADWWPTRPESEPAPVRGVFNILAINNNLPNASDIMTYNGEIPAEKQPEPETPSSEPAPSEPQISITIIDDNDNKSCGNKA